MGINPIKFDLTQIKIIMKKQVSILLVSLLLMTTISFSQNCATKKSDIPWWKFKQRGQLKANHGQYKPENKSVEAFRSWTVWDQSKGHISDQIAELRAVILAGQSPSANIDDREMFILYDELLTSANNASNDGLSLFTVDKSTSSQGSRNQRSIYAGAMTAKAAAFVFAVGIILDEDENGTYPNGDPKPKYKMYNDNGIDGFIDAQAGIDKMNEYRDRAILQIKKLRAGCSQSFRPVPKDPRNHDVYQWRTKELVVFLTAYDILKTVKNLRTNSVSNDELIHCKVALQGYTRNFYMVGKLFSGVKNNNHTLMLAGALGTAAIVLNDAGHRRIRFNYHPETWGNKASFYTVNTMFFRQRKDNKDERVKMSKAGEEAGYAEGPHYFNYGMEALAPYFVAWKNFVPADYREDCDAGFWRGKADVSNFYHDPDFINLLNWYNKIQTPQNRRPAFDNSFISSSGYPSYLAVLNNGNSYHADAQIFGTNGGYNNNVEFLAVNRKPVSQTFSKDNAMDKSGNLILQSPFATNQEDENKRVQIQVLNECGTQVNGGNHEQIDANSFVVYAGNEYLILDPGYIGYKERKWFNEGIDHNMVSRVGKYPSRTATRNTSKVDPNITVTDQMVTGQTETTYNGALFKKRVSLVTEETKEFFIVEDFMDVDDNDDTPETFWWQIAGNGNINNGSFTEIGDRGDYMYTWTHPCLTRPDPMTGIAPDGTYNILSFSSVVNSLGSRNIITYDSTTQMKQNGKRHFDYNATVTDNLDAGVNQYVNNNVKRDFLDKKVNGDNDPNSRTCGIYTKVRIPISTDNIGKMLTVLWPYECDETLPLMYKEQNWDNALITIDGIGEQGTTLFLAVGPGNGDITYNDPAHRNPIEQLAFNADRINFSLSPVGVKSFKECKAITHFRMGSIDNGTLLKYNDTTYLSATSDVSVGYDLAGKFKYKGYAYNQSNSASSVTMLLPDLEPYIDMLIKDEETNELLAYTYDNLKREITFEVPAETKIQFIVELVDPCILSCFFPETDTTIYYTFNFDEGTTETLGHHLDIVPDGGHLKITKGSKVYICEDNMLANMDSITMKGLPSDEPEDGYTLPNKSDPFGNEGGGSSGGKSSAAQSFGERVGSKRSMIIVNNKAGLILEKSSRTHIGEYSTIYIKEGGNLLIEGNSELEIGGKGIGTGELIAEPGAHVCINDAADIHFYVSESDSLDKNIFYVAMGDDPRDEDPSKQTYMQVDLDAIKGKFKPDSIYDAANYTCIDFCELKNYMLPYGINDRDFGWSNISYPKAVIQMNDTFCFEENITAVLERTLNETRHYLKISAYDPISNQEILGTEFFVPDTVINGWDSTRAVTTTLNSIYPMPFEAGFSYIVQFGTENDCNELDAVSSVFYIQTQPEADLIIPQEACPGYETFEADGSGSRFGDSYTWEVTRIPNTDVSTGDDNFEYYSMDYDDTTLNGVYSDFKFPDFHFAGGYNYQVSLAAINICGIETETATIDIPLSARVSADKNLLILGGTPSSTALLGEITGTTNFTWSPTSTLDDELILNPNASPHSTTNYILTATEGLCSESDTVEIQVNLYGNAGDDKIICAGESVLIGTAGSLPPGYSFNWTPNGSIDNSSIAQPLASPSLTTEYILEILDNTSTVIESDKVLVTVKDSTIPGFGFEQLDEFEFKFVNISQPYDSDATASWTFGEGGTSIDLSPEYTYAGIYTDTTLEICLTSSNLCNDSMYCDSLSIDSIGVGYDLDLRIAKNSSREDVESENMLQKEIKFILETESSNSNLLMVQPNPFIGSTRISWDANLIEGKNALLEVVSSTGKLIYELNLNRLESSDILVDFKGKRNGVYYAILKLDGQFSEVRKIILID